VDTDGVRGRAVDRKEEGRERPGNIGEGWGKWLGASVGWVMSTHTSVLVDSVGPPSAEVCRTTASFP
jgi:hypothetical protein